MKFFSRKVRKELSETKRSIHYYELLSNDESLREMDKTRDQRGSAILGSVISSTINFAIILNVITKCRSSSNFPR